MRLNLSLENKIFYLFVLIIVVAVGFIGWYGFSKTKNAYIASAYEISKQSTKALDIEIQEHLEPIAKDVLYTANFYALKRYLIWEEMGVDKKSKQWKQIFSDTLINFLETKQDYYKARVINLNKDEVLSARYEQDTDKAFLQPNNEFQNKKGRDYVEKTLRLKKGEFYISKFNLNIEHGKIEKPYIPVVRYATPMIDENKELMGIFVVNIYADHILQIIQREESQYKNKYIKYFLVAKNGDYIYHQDEHKRWATQLKHKANFNKEHFALEKFTKDKQNGVFTHNDKIYSFHKVHPLKSLDDNYWYIISVVDTDIALLKLEEFKFIFFLILFTILIGSFILIKLYISRLIKPLSKVTNQLKALAKGEIKKENIQYNSDDEIKEIVDSTAIVINSIEKTINQARAVANGDFTKDIELLSSEDKLGYAILDMTKRLKEITSLARSLSMGNYDIEIIAKGSDDELGLALIQMIKYLENITSVAESIAIGQIDIKYKAQGRKDRLGHAILQMIRYLKIILKQSNSISNEDFSNSIESKGKNDELGNALVSMTNILRDTSVKNKNEIWFSEGLGEFSDKLTGIDDTKNLAKEAITIASRYVGASSGVLYTFEKQEKELNLIASFAFNETARLSDKFKLGEGVVGQVGLEKKDILLKNIKNKEYEIQSGTTVSLAKEVFVFPLIYKDELFGVAEMMNFGSFTKLQQEYLLKAASIFATALNSTTQNVKIKTLLEESQSAFEELQVKSEEMQVQSEELRATNEQMEEQQQQLEIQSANLQIKNVEIEKAKKEIDKKATDLEASNQYKSEFLANMSHELRTPLNSVILLSSLLAKNNKENLNKSDIQKANVINESGNELLRLINDILDLSKIESGKMELIVDKINPTNLLASYDEVFSHSAQDKSLEFKIVDNYGEDFYNDKDRLGQVIRNLVSNALKFTQKGSVTLEISKTNDKKLPVKISVIDTGIGIPKDKQKLIFKAFTQADGSTSRQFGGTGLGLSITKELSHLMGGEIELESIEEKGSVFSVLLPSLDDSYDKNTPKAQKPNKIKSSDTLINKKEYITKIKDQFLVIEDDKVFANILKETIEEYGAKVFVAYNGKDGLELANQHNIKGAIIDIGLPDMSGIDVIKQLKENKLTQDIHIQVISGKDRQEQKFDDLKIDGYLQKPVSSAQINNAIVNIEDLSDDIKSILIVEDDKAHLKAIADYIQEDNDYEIVMASCVKEAKKLCEEKYFDIAIIDLGLGDGNGSEICQCFTSTKKDTAILIYTGRDVTTEEADYLNEISDEIIIKNPKSHERLKDEIERFLTTPHETVNERFKAQIRDMDHSNHDISILKDKKVLIVDDDIKNIFVLSSALQEHDMNISHAKNGQEALDFLKDNLDTDIVLMDIMMPVMNGYEAMEAIRADKKLKHLPMIAVTAKAMEKDKQAALKSGADDYLTKPIDLEKLSSMMAMWINK